MSATSDPEDSIPVCDNDRLIAAMHSCFSDLIKKQEEIHRAIESLKPPAPATDPKTTFWNTYMKLADEHDKEFQQKYSTDLDTSLIFAGLFSAVASAFIIQIQPQLMSPPTIIVVVQCLLYASLFTTLLAALLAVLGKQWIMHYHAAGSRGTIEERGLERQRKLDGLRRWKFNTVLQMFPLLLQLALLLFSTALSLYLWTANHAIAIIVLIITTSGFASYLFLLISASISPDSPFQSPVAAFFVRTLSPPLQNLQRKFWWKSLQVQHFVSKIWKHCFEPGRGILPCFGLQSSMQKWDKPDLLVTHFDGYSPDPASPEVPAVLWVLETSTDPAIIDTAAEIAADLQWPLDLGVTSPLTRLAEALDSCFHLRYEDHRFIVHFREGLIKRFINCARAYCSLRLVARAAGVNFPEWSQAYMTSLVQTDNCDSAEFRQLVNVWQILQDRPDLPQVWETLHDATWALHIIPSLFKQDDLKARVELFLAQFPSDEVSILDQETFANYLCCISTLLGYMNPRIMAQKHKGRHGGLQLLLAHLFKTLQKVDVDASLVEKIINTTVKQSQSILNAGGAYSPEVMRETLLFCSHLYQLNGTLTVQASALTLARIANAGSLNDDGYQRIQRQPQLEDVEWIYVSLEHVQRTCEERGCDFQNQHNWDKDTVLAIDTLLQALACSGNLPKNPPLKCLRMILQALAAPGDIAVTAFFVLEQGFTWFQEPDLWPILRRSDVWARIGRVSFEYPQRYISLGNMIVGIPGWKSLIADDLSPWIAAFIGDYGSHREMFNSVMRTVWVPHFDEQRKFKDEGERSWAVTLTALANAWELPGNFLSVPHEFARLARCTVSASLLVKYRVEHHNRNAVIRTFRDISPGPRATFSKTLAEALRRAAEKARTGVKPVPDTPHFHLSQASRNTSESLANFLEALGAKIGTEFIPGRGEMQLEGSVHHYEDWKDLENIFMEEIDRLEELFDQTGYGTTET